MSVRSVSAIALALVVIVSLLTIWFYPSIQDFLGTNPFWNGLRDFSSEMNVDWSDSLSEAISEPEETVLVEIPYSPYNSKELDGLEEFLTDGGCLLLADDYGYGNSVLERLGLEARFSGKPLLDPLFCYKNPWLPRVTDFDNAVVNEGIKAVVLNHGTALVGVPTDHSLAWSSQSSFLDNDDSGTFDKGEPSGPLSTAAVFRLGRGTVVLLSDPSILINSMVDRDDNRAFVRFLIEEYGAERNVVADVSRLPKAPLDESKLRLSQTRERISHPYSVAVMLGAVVLLVFRPWKQRDF